MNYTENYQGIKLDVQAVDITIGVTLQERIRKMLTRLHRHYSEIIWVDIHFEDKSEKSTHTKSVNVRVGVSGGDAFAKDSGDDFMALMTNVEDKLLKQLEKMKN